MPENQSALNRLRGAIPALVTPYLHGEIDDDSFIRQLHRVLAAGCNGVVVAGSTGEGFLLEQAEYLHLIELAKKHTSDDRIVVAGVCHPSSKAAANQANHAEQAGADALLVTVPPYIRPNDAGIIAHYETVARRTRLPLLLYNIPSRTGCNASVQAISHLAKNQVILGIKESGDNTHRIHTLVNALPEGFALLCGDDHATPVMHQAGFRGTISVMANLHPELIVNLHKALEQGDESTARSLYEKTGILRTIFAREPNPQAIKLALSLAGICHDEVRLPLVRCSHETARLIEAELSKPPS